MAHQLEVEGKYRAADVVDGLMLRCAQQQPAQQQQGGESMPAMPAQPTAADQKIRNIMNEVRKLGDAQKNMLEDLQADITDLKAIKSTVSRGARDFWKFRRWKSSGAYAAAQQGGQGTNMAQFGLRAAPAPQMRNSSSDGRTAQVQSPAPAARGGQQQTWMPDDEVEEFFQWLEQEQLRKSQGGNMFPNMNLPFQIG
ncbi:MAG: hypothetical protein JSS66_07030 [Armatimonadetes bacterium]|nr:hypothetical protein [Armatimonadota bacterium]